ncbi:hypothetical protein HAT91_00996 [Dickeya solani]|nr:hypothetical protein HAT91_00996 [Dickeya solani]
MITWWPKNTRPRELHGAIANSVYLTITYKELLE